MASIAKTKEEQDRLLQGHIHARAIIDAQREQIANLQSEVEYLRKFQKAITESLVDGRLKGIGPDQ